MYGGIALFYLVYVFIYNIRECNGYAWVFCTNFFLCALSPLHQHIEIKHNKMDGHVTRTIHSAMAKIAHENISLKIKMENVFL